MRTGCNCKVLQLHIFKTSVRIHYNIHDSKRKADETKKFEFASGNKKCGKGRYPHLCIFPADGILSVKHVLY